MAVRADGQPGSVTDAPERKERNAGKGNELKLVCSCSTRLLSAIPAGPWIVHQACGDILLKTPGKTDSIAGLSSDPSSQCLMQVLTIHRGCKICDMCTISIRVFSRIDYLDRKWRMHPVTIASVDEGLWLKTVQHYSSIREMIKKSKISCAGPMAAEYIL